MQPAAAAKAKAAAQAKAKAFFAAKMQTSATPKDSIMLSPRNTQTKRTNVSTPTSKSDTSVAAQGNKQKLRIDGPSTITITSKAALFDDATKELVPVHELTHPDCPHTDQDFLENGEHNRLITDDSLFVMETAGLDLSKDPHNKVVILQIISEKIEELKTLKAVQIEDNPDSERFLNIISNFKQSQFGKIFAVIPSNSNKKYINVKNLFCTTVTLRRQDLGLPEFFGL